MPENFFEKATNPEQYDQGEMDFSKVATTSPLRKFFADCLEHHLESLSGKSLIDIGSGGGYCSEVYKKLGAREYSGIEPSKNNILTSQKFFPNFKVIQGTLQDLNPATKFDVVVSVMVFEHIADPVAGFKKIESILNPGGFFYLICDEKDHGTLQRNGYIIETQDLGNGEVAVATTRDFGTMYDVFRPIENYINYAKEAGLVVKQHIPLTPSEKLLKEAPRSELFRDKTIFHLLIFTK